MVIHVYRVLDYIPSTLAAFSTKGEFLHWFNIVEDFCEPEPQITCIRKQCMEQKFGAIVITITKQQSYITL